MTHRRILLLLVLLSSAACAGGHGGSPLYRREIGIATAADASMLAEQVIHRYGYQIDRAEDSPEIRILTHWRPRLPFVDEAALGATAAESRILVVARIRSHTELGAHYNIMFTMENRLQMAMDLAWNESLNTRMFREYAGEIANDFRQLVSDIGVRRHR
jgi:hypothetical protein